MILDGHIHISGRSDNGADFVKRLQQAAVDGGVLISLPPPSLRPWQSAASTTDRLDNLISWKEAGPNLYPFYWLDPLEADAQDQIEQAIERGVTGFKMICDRYRVSDERAMEACRAIARHGRPILFHSGILWDGKPSSWYCRPVEFEALIEVQGLRFCLAHIGWPWCDELIAVYGKILQAKKSRADADVEMFVDITPGTPPIYREEALTKLLKTGYDIERNVIFGSDGNTADYSVASTTDWLARDARIFQSLGLPQETIDAIYHGNLMRFLGVQPGGGQ